MSVVRTGTIRGGALSAPAHRATTDRGIINSRLNTTSICPTLPTRPAAPAFETWQQGYTRLDARCSASHRSLIQPGSEELTVALASTLDRITVPVIVRRRLMVSSMGAPWRKRLPWRSTILPAWPLNACAIVHTPAGAAPGSCNGSLGPICSCIPGCAQRNSLVAMATVHLPDATQLPERCARVGRASCNLWRLGHAGRHIPIRLGRPRRIRPLAAARHAAILESPAPGGLGSVSPGSPIALTSCACRTTRAGDSRNPPR
jgi:hypothetical protein